MPKGIPETNQEKMGMCACVCARWGGGSIKMQRQQKISLNTIN